MAMADINLSCKCGKSYKHFSSYKKHFLSCISNPKSYSLGVAAEQQQITSPSIVPVNINNQSIPSVKEPCPFCQLKINSNRLKNHINNICQQRFKNTPEYIELSKIGLIMPGLTNKEICAMCRVIQHLSSIGRLS